jgi:hypothetical protein
LLALYLAKPALHLVNLHVNHALPQAVSPTIITVNVWLHAQLAPTVIPTQFVRLALLLARHVVTQQLVSLAILQENILYSMEVSV